MSRKPYSHYRVVTADGGLNSLSARVLHPRRRYPFVQVFVHGVFAAEFEFCREDCNQIVDLMVTADNLQHFVDLEAGRAVHLIPSVAKTMLLEAGRSVPD